MYFDVKTGRVHDFCCNSHAQLAISLGEWPLAPPSTITQTCALPGCSRLVAWDSHANTLFFYCSRDHALRAREKRMEPPPSEHYDRVFTGQNNFRIALMKKSHAKYDGLKEQFQKQWKKRESGVPVVQRIYKITNPPEVYSDFEAYAAKVGNVQRRFHGTSLDSKCTLGVHLDKAPCNSSKCAICNICRVGFDMALSGGNTNFLRYGGGLYFSATSGKSNDYAGKVAFGGKTYKAMFVCKVAAGKPFITKKGDTSEFQHLGIPPVGYDSVVGEPGQALNYDELVVYNNSAAIPCYLIIYTI